MLLREARSYLVSFFLSFLNPYGYKADTPCPCCHVCHGLNLVHRDERVHDSIPHQLADEAMLRIESAWSVKLRDSLVLSWISIWHTGLIPQRPVLTGRLPGLDSY